MTLGEDDLGGNGGNDVARIEAWRLQACYPDADGAMMATPVGRSVADIEEVISLQF